MDEIKRYKEEMLRLSKRADKTLSTAEDNNGKLVVIVSTLKGIYPIKNAAVTVFRGSAANMQDEIKSYTDQSGKTAEFSLSAPPAALSRVPQNEQLPYSLYGVLIHADGYRDKIILNLPVFSGVTSMQSVSLISINESDKNKMPLVNSGRKNFDLGGV